jgi:hypothetical protein
MVAFKLCLLLGLRLGVSGVKMNLDAGEKKSSDWMLRMTANFPAQSLKTIAHDKKSYEDLMKEISALKKANAEIAALKKENAALKDVFRKSVPSLQERLFNVLDVDTDGCVSQDEWSEAKVASEFRLTLTGTGLKPTVPPTDEPTEEPTEDPTETPTETPTQDPTEVPTATPTETTTDEPTEATLCPVTATGCAEYETYMLEGINAHHTVEECREKCALKLGCGAYLLSDANGHCGLYQPGATFHCTGDNGWPGRELVC